MDLVSPTPNRLEYIHDDKVQARVSIVILAIGAIACAVGGLAADSLWPSAVALVAAGALIVRIHRQAARTRVIFDKANDRLLLEHRSVSGRLIGSERLALSALENVVLERAGFFHNFLSRKVWQRPVLIVAGRRVPLTHMSYESSDAPSEVVDRLREKLELPRSMRMMDDAPSTPSPASSPPRKPRAEDRDGDDLERRAREIRRRNAEQEG
ncbi:hypothetical protein [Polymorphum gilvum]|uniref:Uncharacterized protein n=1 Tax=Polymorphum gilvum (strain LMG 25793 / CGMCC 1.9160 / SL003B-26A1) TaxID=991905 RepID=F2IUZ3_POLGS|nr:hypothetical protein [Polymorphum gilvum]ADZ70222.1 hypothetical protein SL003B_1795 [Polymorphum gilvum SL003B-26A1]